MKPTRSLLSFLFGSVFLTAQMAQAATYYWDTNGNLITATPATGTWGTDDFWSTDSTGATATSAQTIDNTSDLFFSAAANSTGGTVTINGTQSAHSITFDDATGGITLSGGTAINLGSATAGSGLFFTSAIGSANTISTGIILNSAATAIAISNSGTALQTIGDITGSAAGLQTLTVGASSTGGITLNGIIGDGGGGGTVGLTVNSSGAGVTTLTGANTYTGATTINRGMLTLNSATGSLATTTPLTFSGTGTFNMDNVGASSNLAQTLGALTFSAGQGTAQITRTAAFDQAITFASLAARTAGATGNFVNAGGTNSAGNGFVFTAAPTAGTLIDRGIFFNGSSYATYDVGGFVRGFTAGDTDYLAAPTAATIGASTATSNVEVTGAITAQTTVSANTLNLGANNLTFSNAANILSVNGILSSGSATAAINNNTTASKIQATAAGNEIVIRVNGGADVLTINQAIRNFGVDTGGTASRLTKSGDGKLILTAANTYTGTTTINAGTLQIGNGSTTGALATTSNIVVNGGGNLTINRSDAVAQGTIFANNITGAGSVTYSGGALTAAITLSGNSHTGGFILNSGFVTGIAAGTYGGFGTGTVTINGAGIAGLRINSGANATITNAMNWNGTSFAFDRGASSTPTVNWNGNITLGNNVTVNSASGFGAAGGNYIHIFNGAILDDGTGGRSLAFTTNGTGGRQFVTLNGNNTFTGGISITQGSLTIGGSGKLGGGDYSGNITISGTTTAPLIYSSSSDQILRGVISLGSSMGLTKDTSATSKLTLSGGASNTYSGLTTVSAGTLGLNKSGAFNAIAGGGLTINTGGTVQYNASAGSNQIGDASVVTVAGGTFDMNSISDTLGSLVYNSGTISNVASPLILANNTATALSMRNTSIGFDVALSGTTTTGVGVTFDATNNGTATISGGLNLNSSATAAITRTFTINNGSAAVDMDITGVISNTTSTALTKSGAGILQLSGSSSNTYGGLTTVSAGALNLNKSGTANAIGAGGLSVDTGATVTYTGASTDMIANAAAVTITGTGQLNLNGVNDTIGTLGFTAVAGNNALVATGAGTLTLGGGVTFTAATTGTAQVTGLLDLGAATRTFTVGLGTSANQDLLVGANISGTSVGLTKAGGGRLTLSGTNAYNGGTTITTGTLQFANTAAMPATGNVAVGTGATLAVNAGAASGEFTNATSGNGSIGGLLAGLGGQSGSTVSYAGNVTLGIDTTNAVGSTMTYSGIIGNVGATLGLSKLGTGTLVLDQANTYTGATSINGGTLVAAHVSALGDTSSVAISTSTGSGILHLATDTTVNAFDIVSSSLYSGTIISDRATAGAGITHVLGAAVMGNNTYNIQAGSNVTSGTAGVSLASVNLSAGNAGTLAFNAIDANLTIVGGVSIGNSSFAKTLELSGGSTGNAINGVISNGLNILTLNKTGTGTWTLSAANTFTGATTITGGTLALTNALALQNSALVTTTGTSTMGAFSALTIGGLSGSRDLGSANVLSGYTGNVSALTLNPQSGVSVAYSGIISDGTLGMTLTKTGTGSQTLSGANSYTGSTTVSAGTLTLDYATENNSKLSDSSALILGGGALTLSGGSHTEVVASTTLQAGTASSITRSSGTSVLQLGTITVNAAAFLNLGAAGIATTNNTNDATGILGTWARVGSDWAINSTNGANGSITAYTGYSDLTRLASGTKIIADSSTSNMRIVEGTGGAANITIAAATTSINTLLNSAVGGTGAVTVDVGTGNILRTSAIMQASTAGVLTIGVSGATAGTLSALSAGGDLAVIANSTNGVTINSAIANHTSASSLTKLGTGTLTLTSASSYTGATVINAGTLDVSGQGISPLSTSSGLTFTGNSTFIYAGGVNTALPSMTINSGVTASVNNSSSGNNSNFTMSSLSGAGTFKADNPGGTGQGKNITFGSMSAFTGVLQFANTGSSFAFTTPTLNDTVANNIILSGNATSTPFRFQYNGSAGMTLTNRAFEMAGAAGSNLTINNNGTANSAFTINSNLAVTASGAKTLQLGGTNTGGTSTFAGNIDNGSGAVISLTKDDGNTWTLSGDNTYTGTTTLNNGGLVVNTIKDFGMTSSLGRPTSGAILVERYNGTKTLSYVGTGDTSNRTFKFQGYNISGAPALTLTNDGAGALIFSASTFNEYSTSSNNIFTLNLGGTYTGGTNEIQGTIQNHFSGVSDVLNLTKNGNSTWMLSGTNTYTGTTLINGGTLVVGTNAPSASNGALGNTASEVQLGVAGGSTNASLLIGGAYTVNRIIRIPTSNTSDGGTRVLTLGGNTADNSVFSGNIFLGTTNQAGRGVTLTAASGGQVTFSGVIQNPTGMDATAYTVTKSGLGTVVLSVTNTYTGATSVGAGTLTLSGGNSAATSGAITVGSNGQTGVVLNITGGTYTMGTNGVYVGNSTTAGQTGTLNQTGGTLNLTATGGLALLVGNGNGTGIYNFSAGSIVNAGAATTSRGLMLGVNAGASAANPTVGTFNLSGTGNLNLTNATLMVGRSDSSQSNLTSTYNQTGGTATVTTLTIGGTGAANNILSNFSVTGGTFEATTFALLGAASGTGNTAELTVGGTAVVTLPNLPAKNANHSVTFQFDGGTLRNSAAGTFITGLTNAFIQDGGAQFDTSLNSTTISQDLQTHGSSLGGGLTKVGSNTLTLTGANTYTGGTTLNQGTLTIGTGGTLGATTGTLSVNNTNSTAPGTDAIVNLATAVDTTVGSLSGTIATPTSGTNTATINNGGVGRNFTVNQTSAGTYAGVIAGAGSFTLGSSSTNALTLTGINTYTGATNVDGGKLIINGSISTSSVVTVGANGILGGAGTIGGATTIAGDLQPGSSPGILDFTSTLALQSTANTTMEILGLARGTDYDGVDVGDELTYDGDLIVDFGTTFLTDQTFNLFDFSSFGGSFDSVSFTGSYTGSLVDGGGGVWGLADGDNTWTFTQSTGDLALTVIPEPGAVFLGSMGLLLILRRRR